MNNEKNNGRGIFYGVIGVATLVVAIIGATFAYFTATQDNNTAITGNAASVNFGLKVERAETNDAARGLIPMSNSMVESAVSATTPCVDDRSNSVCQIYKVTLTNSSASALDVDGFVTLTGGLKNSGNSFPVADGASSSATTNMRWAQVFATGSAGSETYSTGGTTNLGVISQEVTMTAIGKTAAEDSTGLNKANIYGVTGGVATVTDDKGTTANPRVVIDKNYIRTSNHTTGLYTAANDLADALVLKLNLPASGEKVLYFVVWLHENAQNQTPASAEEGTGFFGGTVTFNTGDGGGLTATFSGYAETTTASIATPAP